MSTLTTEVTPRELSGVDRLWGEGAFAKLQSSVAVVIGIGGVGSWCAEALARSALGSLILIDLDHVSPSNINRQLIATQNTLGLSKVEVMKRRIESIHSWTCVHVVEDMLEVESGPSIFDRIFQIAGERPLVMIDCCDDTTAKAWLIKQQQHLIEQHSTTEWKLVISGAAGGKKHPQMIRLQSLSSVTHDPLISSLRKRLKHAIPAEQLLRLMESIDCVYSIEPVATPKQSDSCDPRAKLHCSGYGSSVMVTASFGMNAAACATEWLLKDIRHIY